MIRPSLTIPHPLTGVILAGTDTAVGKTTVARALLRLAARSGLRLLPFKPVETGCQDDGPRDSLDLIQAASAPSLTSDDVCPYSFAAPLSPSVASRMEGRRVELAVLLEAAHALAARADALLVEGAGGLLSPWAPGLHLGTFAADLQLPLLIVAPNRLGTINQTALVASECRRRELPCLGFVLVDVSPIATPDHDTNAEEIVRETQVPFLGALPYLDPTNVDDLADRAAMTLDVTAILQAASRPSTVPL